MTISATRRTKQANSGRSQRRSPSEYGFRSVKYIGTRKLLIDYSISGKLDHSFVFPFNPDADVILPFIAIELRGKDKLRVKAPGYANQQSMSASMGGLGGMPALDADADASSALDGTFTLTTNATIVSQNQEDGAQPAPNGTKKIVWKANPQTKEAPFAVLQVAPFDLDIDALKKKFRVKRLQMQIF